MTVQATTVARTLGALMLAGGLAALGGHDAAAQQQQPQAQQQQPQAQQQQGTAAQQQPQMQQQQGTAAPQQYTEAQLESFAEAAVQVNEIATEYQPRIQQAASPEEARSLVEEANTEMEAAIENAGGITVEEYKGIVEAARQDPQLRERIGGILEQKAGG